MVPVGTEQRMLMTRGALTHNGEQRRSVHVDSGIDAEPIEQCWCDVDGLTQFRASNALRSPGHVNEERRMDDFLVHRPEVLSEVAVLAEQKSMVGVDDEKRVLPQAIAVESVENPSELRVAQGDQGGVLTTALLELARVRPGINRRIGRPVESRGIGQADRSSILLGNIERLMGIKALDLHEPVVSRGVSGEEI